MQKVILLAVFLGLAAAVPLRKLVSTTAEEDLLWDRFKSTYNKAFFDNRDESYRKGVFVVNLRMINKHNAEADDGVHTFTMAMNEFGDMTTEEFFAKYTGYLGSRQNYLHSRNVANLSHVSAADEVDWTTKGAVTPVKNQGQCGSCWAFSATGSIEGAWFQSKNELVSFSEQQLVDCSGDEGNQGCNGGLMDSAFEYVIKTGLDTEADYKYTARDGSCKTSAKAVGHISSYVDVGHTEDDLAKAVTLTPVSVAIEADQSSFQFYSSGVLTGTCGSNLDHGVLAVGYGTLSGTEYWKVKNSWGGSWGMNGYVLIQKGKKVSGGQCGILLAASYPVV